MDGTGNPPLCRSSLLSRLHISKLDFGQSGGLAEGVGPGWWQAELTFLSVAFAT